MRMLVLGAGLQGSACAFDLLNAPAVREVTIADMNWIAGESPHTHWVYTAKTRYRMPDTACEIERIDTDRAVVRFAAPQWAVTPGQSLVLYESRVCLGGGIIESTRMAGRSDGANLDLRSLAD